MVVARHLSGTQQAWYADGIAHIEYHRLRVGHSQICGYLL
jgi:hypothetical protein